METGDFGPICDLQFERNAIRIGVDTEGFFEYWELNSNVYRRAAHGSMRWECTVSHWNSTIGGKVVAEAKMTGTW